MTHGLTSPLALAPVFAALLAGCTSIDSTTAGCGDQTSTSTFELSPEEYAQWMKGMPPDETPMAATTTDATGTGGSTTTGAMLTDDEICMMVCAGKAPGEYLNSCAIKPPNAEGNIPVECTFASICVGRRHPCVRSFGDRADLGPAAAWLARAAHDEAASVHAFLALAVELAAHDAPAELLARMHRAADDERRHAALTTALAHAHGATITTPSITDTPGRDLLALAVDNMVEGCVRETWAALEAAHQARHAHTPEIRSHYASIATDEAQHAELAWSIHTWLIGQLNPAEQAMVAAARHAAVRQLQTSLAAHADEPELLALGLPGRNTALHLLAGLDAALWSQAA